MVVLGPGLGESVIVGWPSDNWLVVDSFHRVGKTSNVHPALELLERFDAYADAVVLTHPHIDHTGGLSDLVDRRKSDGHVGWWPEPQSAFKWSTSNAGLSARQGSAEHAIAAINRAWTESPSSRWELSESTPPLTRGGATIKALTPLKSSLNYATKLQAPDMNELSTAILFEWRSVSLLLGGDLVNRRGWDGLENQHGQRAFANTDGVKVPHHGSAEAQHPVALGTPPPTDRVFLATPYNRGRKVPDYRPNGDVAQLLRVMNRLLISAHHGQRPPGADVADIGLSNLGPAQMSLPRIPIELDADQPSVRDCWVAAQWSANGSLVKTMRGTGSMSVVI